MTLSRDAGSSLTLVPPSLFDSFSLRSASSRMSISLRSQSLLMLPVSLSGTVLVDACDLLA